MTLRGVGTLVLLGVFTLPSSGLSQAPFSQEPIAVAGKFDTATEHLLIPVTIGGHQFWCNPDTGFGGVIALDRAKAIAAGLRIDPGVPTPDGSSTSWSRGCSCMSGAATTLRLPLSRPLCCSAPT